MFPFPALLTPITVAMSLSTATGVFVHDSKIDQATVTAITAAPVVTTGAAVAGAKVVSLSGEFHTHAERLSLSQSVNDLKNQHPRTQPRSDKDRKHMRQRSYDNRQVLFDDNELEDNELSLT